MSVRDSAFKIWYFEDKLGKPKIIVKGIRDRLYCLETNPTTKELYWETLPELPYHIF